MRGIVQIFSRVLLASAIIATLVITTGCEELLDEALQKDITVEEEIFSDQTATAEEESVEVTSGVQLGAAGKLAKSADGSHVIPMSVEEAALFSWILSEGGGALRGQVENRDGNPAVFKVYIGASEVIASAVEIGSIEVGANQSSQFSFQGALLENFFKAQFEAGAGTFYLILYGESDSVNLWISNLEFVLQPGAVIRTTVGPSSEYAEYADTIDDITDLSLAGSIRNNGASPVALLLRIGPEAPTPAFEAFSVGTTIAAGSTFDLNDWHTLFDAETLADMGDAISYLATGAVVAELFFTSETGVNVTVISVVLLGTVSVGL